MCNGDALVMNNRASTPEQKREVIERLYAAWCEQPDMRLGQLIQNSVLGDIAVFYVEDYRLIESVETFVMND